MKRLTEYTIPEIGFSVVSQEKYKRILMEEKPSVEKVYNRLKKIEDILGDEYELDRLRELVGADREGRCFVFRFGFGETVYRIWVHPSGEPAFVTENRMDTLNDLLNAETWDNAYKTRAEAEAALRREQE